jgi:glycosyltransferase involved in cell wall biosynthesis
LPPSRLRVAGYKGPDQQQYFDGIVRQLEAWGLAGEFEYAGAPDRAGKFAFLRGLDVLSVPSPYHEPKGLYLLEAMAAGVPVVAPAYGAFPELLQATQGGLVADSGNATDIAGGLLRIWNDASLGARLGRQGRAAVAREYTLARMAERVERVYEEAAGQGIAPRGNSPARAGSRS